MKIYFIGVSKCVLKNNANNLAGARDRGISNISNASGCHTIFRIKRLLLYQKQMIVKMHNYINLYSYNTSRIDSRRCWKLNVHRHNLL